MFPPLLLDKCLSPIGEFFSLSGNWVVPMEPLLKRLPLLAAAGGAATVNAADDEDTRTADMLVVLGVLYELMDMPRT